MIPISVCIITKNEAESLDKCLKSLSPYPFEIVVVDTGSTDNSKEIAHKYTNKRPVHVPAYRDSSEPFENNNMVHRDFF